MHPNMRLFVVGALCLIGSPMASAHFNVMLPQDYGQWSARRGESISCRLVWGHGYEHAWIDARTPAELVAISPVGKRTDLMPALKPTKVVAADGKACGAFAFAYQPQERGDHVLALKAALLWDADDGIFLQDYAKSILHVQDKTGWDRRVGHKFELVALNRPYAMLRGQVIRMLVLYDGKPLPNCESRSSGSRRRLRRRPTCPARSSLCSRPEAIPAVWSRSGFMKRVGSP